MPSPVEILNHRLTALISVLVLVGMGLAFMDSRHASAMDVQQISDFLYESRIDDLEYKIQECERRIRRILLIPEEERDLWDATQLDDELNKKEHYLRKLKRLTEAE